MIRIENLTLRYPNGAGIKNINTVIHPGDVTALIGPSGAGKSTLFHCIIRLLSPESGHIYVDGTDMLDPATDLWRMRLEIGMLFQKPSLFRHMTLLENVMSGPMDLRKKSRQEAYEIAKKLLRDVGLGEYHSHYPNELSGGQQQRGELARCLAMEPKILLLDEPTANLDASMTSEVQAVIYRLAAEGYTILMITHDLEFCRKATNHVIFLNQGQILEEGTPEELFEHPKKDETRIFLQQLRSFRYEIHSRDFDIYALNGGLEQFGLKYYVPREHIRHLELVTEELIQSALLKHTDQIVIEVRFNQLLREIEIRFTYQGDPFNPLDNEDEDLLAMLLVRQLISESSYHYEQQNYLQLQLKV